MALKDKLNEVKDKFKKTEEVKSESVQNILRQRAAAKQVSDKIKSERE